MSVQIGVRIAICDLEAGLGIALFAGLSWRRDFWRRKQGASLGLPGLEHHSGVAGATRIKLGKLGKSDTSTYPRSGKAMRYMEIVHL